MTGSASHLETETGRGPTEPRAGLRLVPTGCCICGSAPAEPVAVGEDFSYPPGRDLFLAVQCNGCGLIYLDPVPAPAESDCIRPAACYEGEGSGEVGCGVLGRTVRPGELAAWIGDLPPGARVLDVGHGLGGSLVGRERYRVPWRLDAIDIAELTNGEPSRGAYEVVLIAGVLEELPDPAGALAAAVRLLAPTGRVLVLVHNTASASFRIFRGRHWAGYDFPRRRHLFSPPVLGRLAERAGLEVKTVRMVPYPVMWTRSAARFLRDWGAAAWLLRLARLLRPSGLLAATALEHTAARWGGASLMVATLQPGSGSADTA